MRISRNLLLVSLASLLNDVSSEMIYPVLPFFIVGTLAASPAVLGLIEGMAESLASVLRLVAGRVSDGSRRRKPLTIAGYVISLTGKGLLAGALGWPMVLASRALDRVGKAARTAPRDALIAESVSTAERGQAFGFHRMMDTAGAVAGVLIAIAMLRAAPDGTRTVLLWALLPVVLAVACLFWVREVPRPLPAGVRARHASPAPVAAPPPRGAPVKAVLAALPLQLKLFLGASFVFALAGSSNQFLLLREQTHGRGPLDAAKLYLVYNIVYALAAWPAGHLSDRFGRRAVLVAGYAVYGLTYLGFAVCESPAWSWVLWSVYGIYVACTEGVEKALVADLAPGEHRATTLGLHALIVGIGLLPASWLAGWMWERLGHQAVFLFGGALGLCAAAGLLLILTGRPPSAPTPPG